ncbi:MAG TPA: decaprenyl-phosphate phosphoribosyltransferase [Candidatus Kapabacteria bacterium]|nr:decaprenyl-phosphate phosphoribosyltransferase [Candidatus Kapabacteria bacterium]
MKTASLLRLLRPKQWIKNLFVFAALVFSQHLFDWDYAKLSLLAFALFSGTASIIYIVNDIVDRERDRAHPKKRHRPIASGAISVPSAISTAIIVLGIVIPTAFGLPLKFGMCLAIYFVMNISYSFFLKEVVLIDVFVIAIGFMLRVVSGAFVIGVPISSWLILTTMFLSLFLAVAKRRGELVMLESKGVDVHTRKVLEHYSIEFAEQLCTICAAGFVISYALYTVSDRTVKIFGTENLILTTPFVLFGVFRYLYLLHKKNLGESPTEIVLTDVPMILNFAAYAAAMFFIIYIHR